MKVKPPLPSRSHKMLNSIGDKFGPGLERNIENLLPCSYTSCFLITILSNVALGDGKG